MSSTQAIAVAEGLQAFSTGMLVIRPQPDTCQRELLGTGKGVEWGREWRVGEPSLEIDQCQV